MLNHSIIILVFTFCFATSCGPTLKEQNDFDDVREDITTSITGQGCNTYEDEGELVELPKIAELKGEYQWEDSWSRSLYQDLSEDIFKELFTSVDKKTLNKVNCPNFAELSRSDKKKFYVIFLASVAYAESRFKTNTCYNEKGGTHDSFGLTQFDAKNAYYAQCKDRDDLVAEGIKMIPRDILDGLLVKGSKRDKINSKGKKYLRCSNIEDDIDNDPQDYAKEHFGFNMYHPRLNLRCSLFKLKRQMINQSNCKKGSQAICEGSYWAVLRPSRDGHARFLSFVKKHMGQIRGCSEKNKVTSDCLTKSKIQNSSRAIATE